MLKSISVTIGSFDGFHLVVDLSDAVGVVDSANRVTDLLITVSDSIGIIDDSLFSGGFGQTPFGSGPFGV